MSWDRAFIGYCDGCMKSTGVVYEMFPRCRECGDEVCGDCMVPDSLVENDGRSSCICKECQDLDVSLDMEAFCNSGRMNPNEIGSAPQKGIPQ